MLWNWLGVAVSLFTGFVLSPVVMRRLGAERYGIWTLVFSARLLLVFRPRNQYVRRQFRGALSGIRPQKRTAQHGSGFLFGCVGGAGGIELAGVGLCQLEGLYCKLALGRNGWRRATSTGARTGGSSSPTLKNTPDVVLNPPQPVAGRVLGEPTWSPVRRRVKLTTGCASETPVPCPSRLRSFPLFGAGPRIAVNRCGPTALRNLWG